MLFDVAFVAVFKEKAPIESDAVVEDGDAEDEDDDFCGDTGLAPRIGDVGPDFNGAKVGVVDEQDWFLVVSSVDCHDVMARDDDVCCCSCGGCFDSGVLIC